MIEVILNDRLGKKVRMLHACARTARCRKKPVEKGEHHPPAPPSQVRVKCNEDDTIGDLKKLVAAQTGTRPEKIRIQKWYTIYKDHVTLSDYEIHDGMGLELYYN